MNESIIRNTYRYISQQTTTSLHNKWPFSELVDSQRVGELDSLMPKLPENAIFQKFRHVWAMEDAHSFSRLRSFEKFREISRKSALLYVEIFRASKCKIEYYPKFRIEVPELGRVTPALPNLLKFLNLAVLDNSNCYSGIWEHLDVSNFQNWANSTCWNF